MVLVRTAISSRKRKKRVLKRAKGFFAQRHKRYRHARRAIIKAMEYAYRDRKVRTRNLRRLWILRINAACRQEGLTYSRFMNGLKKINIEINRKVLADLAVSSPEVITKLVSMVKESVKA